MVLLVYAALISYVGYLIKRTKTKEQVTLQVEH